MAGLGSMRLAVVLAGILLFWSCAGGQELGDSLGTGHAWDFSEEPSSFSPGAWIGDRLTPEAVLAARRIRSYVRDQRFENLRKREGDVRAADAIYLRALRISEYDIGRALFLSMLATLEHRHLPLRLPVIGVVSLPLTFEEETLFHARVRHLPRRLYPDSPADERGDRDKLQHFFGAAAVAYSTESPDMARTAGTVVEWGESIIVVGGVDDPRDRRSNMQGEMFGHDLLFIQTMLPSDYLRLRLTVQ